MNKVQGTVADVTGALQGEPLRAIVYGAAVVIFLVTHIALAAGYQGFGSSAPSLDAAFASATVAAAALTEVCRRFVSSPNTVAGLLAALKELEEDLAAAHGIVPPTPQ
jgi:hypothetical protein